MTDAKTHTRSYPGKLLLFGEYTILSGSRGLAIPIHTWSGKLSYQSGDPDPHLFALATYLTTREDFAGESAEEFLRDVTKGLRFTSNIPQGYGVGSSGALCAAVYETYFGSADADLSAKRRALARMEGFFHGTSSGLDPLISLLQVPVLRESEQYHALPPLSWPPGIHAFLLDTGIARETGDLVRKYMDWQKDPEFYTQCLRPLISHVDHAISFFITQHTPALIEQLEMISQLQFQYFQPMIPPSVRELWKSGLQAGGITIKLCGAGGGGFLLGFATSEEALKAFKASTPFQIITMH